MAASYTCQQGGVTADLVEGVAPDEGQVVPEVVPLGELEVLRLVIWREWHQICNGLRSRKI